MSALAEPSLDLLSLEPSRDSARDGVPPAVALDSGFFPRGPVFVVVCAWCQSVTGIKSTEGKPKTALTHGICPECAKDWV